MATCTFCNIISGTLPTRLLYEDEELVIFEDIKPAAQHHYLVVTKEHIKDCKSLTSKHKPLVEKMVEVGKNFLQEKDADLNDVRIGFHVPPFNSIQHLHLHVISPTSDIGFIGRLIFKPNTWWFAEVDYILNNLK